LQAICAVPGTNSNFPRINAGFNFISREQRARITRVAKVLPQLSPITNSLRPSASLRLLPNCRRGARRQLPRDDRKLNPNAELRVTLAGRVVKDFQRNGYASRAGWERVARFNVVFGLIFFCGK
jgi:hypothetical protein